MQVRPTAEQLRALEYFLSGEATAIEAGAGTGKTTTLALCAGATTDQVQYVAFNRSIVQDSRGKLPPNARAHTAHGLAMRAVGHAYEHRLHSSGRMRSSEIAQRLGIEPYVVQLGPGGERKRVSASKLAGYCMAGVTNYCQSADVEPTARHVPYIKGIDLVVDGRPTYTNNDQVATYLEQHMRAAWCDLVNPYRRVAIPAPALPEALAAGWHGRTWRQQLRTAHTRRHRAVRRGARRQPRHDRHHG